MKDFIWILNLLHIPVSESTDIMVLFLLWVLAISLLSLLCLFNILVYVFCLYILSSESRVETIKSHLPVSTHTYFIKILEYYKASRKIFIAFEVSLLIVLLGTLSSVIITILYKFSLLAN